MHFFRDCGVSAVLESSGITYTLRFCARCFFALTKKLLLLEAPLSETGYRLVLSDSGGVRSGLLHRTRLFWSEMGWKSPVFFTGHEHAPAAG